MFTLVDTTEFAARRLRALRYRHACGLEVLSLEAADPENLFSVCFSTRPENDTGVPHIIEHSVLEGSQRYPVKDPFVCMLKSSVATFINAMTYPDRTIYPCTTCCRKDYFNLFDVYWDAVFRPRLTRETFLREGWHYELSGSGAKQRLTLNGIVYNEMSGYYSDPGTVLGRQIERSLFGHTYMRYDSGGAPEHIPSLTYAAFKRFHREHYNPAVARIILYGDIPTAEKLDYIERQLSATPVHHPSGGANCGGRNTAKLKAPSLPAVRRIPFVPDPASRRNGTGIAALAWRLPEPSRGDDLGVQMLENILLGGAGAPLTKALTESKVGSAIMQSGYDNETRFATFSVAMRGVHPRDTRKFERIVLDTLKQCASEGLDRQSVQSAVAGFRLENQLVGSRYVIELLEDILASWCYSDDPFFFLRQSEALPQIRERLASQPRYFEELIGRLLLDNTDRVLIQMKPDDKLQERKRQALRKKLEKRLRGMGQQKQSAIRREARELQEGAQRADSSEALATLPRLRRNDLPAEAPPVPYRDLILPCGLPLRAGTIPHNGIFQLTAVGDLSAFPPGMYSDLALFTALFPTLGNRDYRYDELSRLLASLGASFDLSIQYGRLRNGAPTLELAMQCAALEENFPTALKLFRLQLESISFSDSRRLEQCLRAAAAKGAAMLVNRAGLGHCTARCSAGILDHGDIMEATGGFHAYAEMQQLAHCSRTELAERAEKLQQCAARLLRTPLVAAGYLGGDTALPQMEDFLSAFPRQAALGEFRSSFRLVPPLSGNSGRREFCALETQVACCSRVLPVANATGNDRLALNAICRMLRDGYLWDEIRVKGGAYMVSANCSHALARIALCSGDDPNPAATFRIFDSVQEHLLKPGTLADSAVEQTLIAGAGSFLSPVRNSSLPALCARMLAHGRDNASRQRRYAQLLSLGAGDLHQAAEKFFTPGRNCGNDCAIVPKSTQLDGFDKIILR